MRTPNEDVLARSVAEHLVADEMPETADPDEMDLAKRIVAAFKTVEFEKAVSKVRGGQEINVRRLVLTSSWEVDPDGIGK
jgi:phage terminase large subunit-like protein